jgi:hypothetical protein
VVSAAEPGSLRNSSEVNTRSVALRRQVVVAHRFSLGSLSFSAIGAQLSKAELVENGLAQEAAIGEKLNGERSNDGRKSDSRPNQEVASLHAPRIRRERFVREQRARSRVAPEVSDTVFKAHEYFPADPPTQDLRGPGLSRRGGEWWS